MEWRHPVGADPGFLLMDGCMIGQWYPDGTMYLYIGTAPDEERAQRALEALAEATRLPGGGTSFVLILDAVKALVDECATPPDRAPQFPVGADLGYQGLNSLAHTNLTMPGDVDV